LYRLYTNKGVEYKEIGMYEIGKATNVGIKRKDHPNQDSIGVVLPDLFNWKPPLLIVADGMGGYEGGAIASQIVVETFIREYKRAKTQQDYRELLRNIILISHNAIKNRIENFPEIAKMGSTVVSAILDNNILYIGNVGDSRAYVINQSDIKKASWDHSFVGELVRQGAITPDQALEHPKRNILTMSITAQRPEIDPYVNKFELRDSDAVLLCSDGLWGSVGEEQIRLTVLENRPQAAADLLVDLANKNLGPDNISVIIARKK
jgi:PPM family protein phosphatase